MDDHTLLRRYALGGDKHAFDEIVTRYYALVHRVASSKAQDAQLADDVATTVFLLLAERAHSLGSNVVLAGWLFNAAYYTGCNAFRNEQRRRRREAYALSLLCEQADCSYGPAEPDAFDSLGDGLDQLTQPEREAVLMRYGQGLSIKETAAALGIGADAAHKRASRGLRKLQSLCQNACAPNLLSAQEAHKMQNILEHGTPKQAVELYLNYLADSDIDHAIGMIQGVAWMEYPQPLKDAMRRDEGERLGLTVVSIREPNIYRNDIRRWHVPCALQMKGGIPRKYVVSVRNDNPKGLWEIDGFGDEPQLFEADRIAMKLNQDFDWKSFAENAPAYATAQDMARAFFEYLRNGEVREAWALMCTGWWGEPITDEWAHLFGTFAGMSYRITGEPIPCSLGPGRCWVPYDFHLKGGETKKWFLAARNDTPDSRYLVDGGI